ncbi:MAG: hypothetical protein J0626_03005 [Rhodospirillaceae bacterium]|nr:hypothetical protein [Rhodospirillaceae bacterium]
MNGVSQVHLKIATPDVELNVWIPDVDVARLNEVRTSPWRTKSVRIGEVAGAPAWWSIDVESRSLSILVGLDDETWDVGVTLPLATLDVLLAEMTTSRALRNER